MNFWEKVTGSDMNKEFKSFENRVKNMPEDYQVAWVKIKENLWYHSDFTGRNLMPIFDGVLGMMEEMISSGKVAYEVFGGDIKVFCKELLQEDGANSFRDKWRKKLNNNIAKKLGK